MNKTAKLRKKLRGNRGSLRSHGGNLRKSMKFKEYIYKYIYNIIYVPHSVLVDFRPTCATLRNSSPSLRNFAQLVAQLAQLCATLRNSSPSLRNFAQLYSILAIGQLSKLLVRAQVLGLWLHHSDDFVRGRHGKYFNSGDSSNTN